MLHHKTETWFELRLNAQERDKLVAAHPNGVEGCWVFEADPFTNAENPGSYELLPVKGQEGSLLVADVITQGEFVLCAGNVDFVPEGKMDASLNPHRDGFRVLLNLDGKVVTPDPVKVKPASKKRKPRKKASKA